MISIYPQYQSWVNPTMPYLGGPTGVYTSTLPLPVKHIGHGLDDNAHRDVPTPLHLPGRFHGLAHARDRTCVIERADSRLLRRHPKKFEARKPADPFLPLRPEKTDCHRSKDEGYAQPSKQSVDQDTGDQVGEHP